MFFLAIVSMSRFNSWKDTDKTKSDAIMQMIKENIDSVGFDKNCPILITDPTFGINSNHRFIGAYDVLGKNSLFVNEWENNTNFCAAIYMDSSIPCQYSDSNCVSHKESLIKFLENDFVETDNFKHRTGTVMFYVSK
jgi:hypothetical protein